MAKFNQGLYEVKNPTKYLGNLSKVRFMSSWELHMHKFLDNNPNIMEWASEEIAISYFNQLDKKLHKYYPDYYIKYKNKYGKVIQEIIEVKPANQVNLRKNATKTERLIHTINVAKWVACDRECKKRGIIFRIVTEKQLFSQPNDTKRKRTWRKK